ncbi:MAG: serine/threonine protein kinase [Gemmataceae bacterium]|nr:serine/threonine protein kinase [Gemmataceae bacterium]
MRTALVIFLLAGTCSLADEIADKFPLDPQLKVLAADVTSPSYRELVTKKMLVTDLAAEWQRAFTADNPDSFLEKNGGKEKVLADAGLKAAYERRVKIRADFLDLMREGYLRYKTVPPFDKGEKAEIGGTRAGKGSIQGQEVHMVLPSPGAEKQWSRFRGPTGQGLTGLSSLPVKWGPQENIAWRSPVPGLGNSSPIVWDGRIFLTSSGEKGDNRAVHCMALENGKLLWTTPVPGPAPESGVRDKNGFASATPVTDGERVIAFLGSAGIICLDMEGKVLWHYKDIPIKTTHGSGSSPVLYRDQVFFFHDQNQSDSIALSLDKKTGKLLWKVKRDRAMTWCTPVVINNGGRDEVVFAGNKTVKGYDPANGNTLWTLEGPTVEVVPTLVVGKDMAFCASGRNGPTIAFRLGGAGNITDANTVWKSVRNGPHVPTPILVGGRLFTFNDMGVATCLDAATGKLLWTERLPDQFSASPIEAGGLLYACGESGKIYVVKAADRFEVLAQNDLGSPILASPAVAGGKILIRTRAELVCIGK